MSSRPGEPDSSASGQGSTGERELLELFRLAGVSDVAQLPLDVERGIQQFLRQAGAAIVDRLAAGLEDRDPLTRMRVATYLGQIANPSCVAPLLAGLGDEDARVRFLSVVSLRDCCEVSAVGSLLDALDDIDERVRGAAADAISCLTNHPHGTNPFAPHEERAQCVEELKGWWSEHQAGTRDDLLAAGFRARGHDVSGLDMDGAAGLIEALGDSLPFVRRNAEAVLGRLARQHHTLEDEISKLDPEGKSDYAATRAEALEQLRQFYRVALGGQPFTGPRP